MKCENTPGGYQCVEGCEAGYLWSIKHGSCRGDNRILYIFVLIFQKIDIDECALFKHNCTHGQRCENMPGSFR